MVGRRSDSVVATGTQEESGLIAFSTTWPVTEIPALRSRLWRAFPKNIGGSSIVIGVDHEAGRSGTVPETVTAFEPAARETATRTRPRRPTVRASATGRSMSTAGSIETPAVRPARGPRWLETRTTLSLEESAEIGA